MTPARVGVNLLWLVPGVVGGSEESTLASLRAMHDLAPDDLAVELFALAELRDAHPDVVAAIPTTTLRLPGRLKPLRVGAEATWLSARVRGLDLVHHAGGTAPPIRTAPYVLTVHDLQPLEATATHGSVKRAYLRTALPRSVQGARAVVVPSGFVRTGVVERFGVDPALVHVVPHGVQTWPAAPAGEVRERYGITGPVVLYPAITYPHKNHAALVEAFARIAAEHPSAQLVLTGGAGSAEETLVAQVARLGGIRDRVRRTGRIPRADLAALYGMADVVAVPSRYEGFGLPAVEALAFGAPLVAARATALPEVVGDAGELVDPDDVDGWASALGRLLGDPAERARLATGARGWAERFTWPGNAKALLDVYRAALR